MAEKAIYSNAVPIIFCPAPMHPTFETAQQAQRYSPIHYPAISTLGKTRRSPNREGWRAPT